MPPPEFTYYHSKYFAHRITLEGPGEDAFAKSLSTARIDMKPHQVDAALFALRSPVSKGVILADEVGLGKTIEAGLVIAQRWAERRRQILLIVPASLRKQWQQELRDKFSLPSVILDAKRFRAFQKAGMAQPFSTRDAIVIASYEFAASRPDDVRPIAWDLVVFDEAHKLRNVYRKSGSSRAKELKAALESRFKILLTATPLQNSLMELYGLVSIVDDQFFGDERSFRTLYSGRGDRHALESLRHRLSPLYKRHLRADVQAAGHVSYTQRVAITFDFEPSDRETALYDCVSSYLQRPDTIAFGKANQLVLIGARKTLGSSVAAVAKFLENVIGRLRSRTPVDESVLEDLESAEEENDAKAETFENGEKDAEIAEGARSTDAHQLASEILELERCLDLARSIGSNAKGEKLVAKLPEVLDAVVERGGRRKAVIFTESVRTQRYLADLLSRNGYEGQIVLLNGSNSDAESRRLYSEWQARHRGTEMISGSPQADMKAAVMEAFRDDAKSLLIATESGAEGINLQFCSVVINFDLPWNPQRVEQRIGRCHRYGQKIDVTVVNMLNRNNRAEERVYELLRSKFRLFDGVFGASDEVLGMIESGVDFEKRVVKIVQTCRSEAEIDAAFAAIEAELETKIAADMKAARQALFDTFDVSVVDMLRRRDDEITATLSDFDHRLITLARAELPDASFDTASKSRFGYDGQTWTTEWHEADEKNWRFFRLADGNLARQLADQAKRRDLENAGLRFRYDAYRKLGYGRLSDVEQLIGTSGWVQVSLLHSELTMGNRDGLVIAVMTDDGKRLDPQIVDRLFCLPADLFEISEHPFPDEQMTKLAAAAEHQCVEKIENEHSRLLDDETAKLEAYADDLETAAETRAKELEVEIKAARRALRGNYAISLTDKLSEQRRIKRSEGELDELKLTAFQRRRELRREIDQKLDEVARSLELKPRLTALFTIRWECAA